MKETSKKIKIVLLILLILLIIAGIITLFVKGFEKANEYKTGTRIEIYIPKGYEKQDVMNIATESFNDKKITFEEIEKLNQVAAIRISNYSEEELNQFKKNISEKYEIKEDSLEIHEISIPTTRISTDVEPYIFPTIVVTVLALIYMLFRNLKSEDKWKKILKAILTLILVLGTYFSLILVTRVPFGIYTMPFALAIYIITLLILINKKNK